jgi:uncharacterized protein
VSAGDASQVCRECGACCAAFRVSFYWAEAESLGLPESYTERAAGLFASMAGTNRPDPHCAALQGEVGRAVTCRVYASRPSPCREVEPGDERCTKARVRHGLAPLVARA